MSRDELETFRRIEEANANQKRYDGRGDDAEVIASLLHSGYVVEHEDESLFTTAKGVKVAATRGR